MHHLKSADLYLSVSHLLYFQNMWQLHLQWRKNCSRPVYLDLKILTKWSKFSVFHYGVSHNHIVLLGH